MRVPHKATLKSENEVTGAGMDAKRCRINNLSVKRKNGVFSKGEVFLHLTRPLMGDKDCKEEGFAKYRIRRNEIHQGQHYSITYHIYFDCNEGGIWRIHRF